MLSFVTISSEIDRERERESEREREREREKESSQLGQDGETTITVKKSSFINHHKTNKLPCVKSWSTIKIDTAHDEFCK